MRTLRCNDRRWSQACSETATQHYRICLSDGCFIMLSLLVILPLVSWSSGFNIDIAIPLIRKGDQEGSYFGFSVAAHRFMDGVNRSWYVRLVTRVQCRLLTCWTNLLCFGVRVLVGAPKANDTELQVHKIWSSGALYKCDILSSDNCEQLNFDTRGKRL